MAINETQIKEIFDAGVKASKDKEGILKDLIDAGVGVIAAIREYAKLAKDAGLTMTKEQKEAKTEEVLSSIDWDDEDAFKIASESLSEALDVALSTAQAKVRAYCSDNDIALPDQRVQVATKAEVVSIIISSEGQKKAEISAKLVALGYKKPTADTILSHIPYMKEYAAQVAAAGVKFASEAEAA